MNTGRLLEEAPHVAWAWAAERHDRQQRTKGDPADFQRLRELGVHLLGVPVEFGGAWESLS